MKSICRKCGLPIHYEKLVKDGAVSAEPEWLHDDYKKAWRVDENGRATTLHWADPVETVK